MTSGSFDEGSPRQLVLEARHPGLRITDVRMPSSGSGREIATEVSASVCRCTPPGANGRA